MSQFTQRDLVSFPSPFQRAIMHDSYEPGTSRFSVTGLISPPQRTWLRTLGEEIRSPYGSFAALLGTAMHSILEKHVDEANNEIAERRLYTSINVEGENVSVSGQIDFWENGTLSDYKLTGGVQDKVKPDHFLQAQMNGLLANLNGIPTHQVSVVYVQKEWSHLRSTVDPNYPRSPFRVFLMPYEETLAMKTFQRTTEDHLAAANGKPRPCTPEEQWRRPTSYALMKPGAKRASKLCDTHAEAQENLKPGQFIETRPGEAVYCNSFCGLNHLCGQFKRENQAANSDADF